MTPAQAAAKAFGSAAADRWLRFRYRKYRARLPRISYAVNDPGIRAYVNAVKYRKYRKYVLSWVLVRMAARKLTGAGPS